MLKTHGSGTLRSGDASTQVTLAGWVNAHRDHGGVKFVDLRDASGVVQVVCSDPAVVETAHKLRNEWCIQVTGEVRLRPGGTTNTALPTGEVELIAAEIVVLSECPALPFQIEDDVQAEEATRLKYRYLDLRRPVMLQTLRTRAKVVRTMHNYLDDRDFIEIETPILGASTPEGARDFLVPSRLQPGTFYALLQSPQILKQTLMAAGVERYYQIAKCLRDEDLRGNRQPEHTQLDLEVSFAERDDIFTLIEGLFAEIWKQILDVDVPTPFERLTFADAIERFGTDKPDLRAGPELTELTQVFEGTEFKAFAGVVSSGGAVKGLKVAGAGSMSRSQLDALIERAKELGASGLVWMVAEEGSLRAPISKFLSAGELDAIRSTLQLSDGDLALIVAGDRTMACEVLGQLRLDQAKAQGLIKSGSDPADWNFLWVVDFPLFEKTDTGWDSAHNPFTAPSPGWEDKLEADPGAVPSQQYDMVLNGEELLSGSIRNHRPEVQAEIFKIIGLSDSEARERFGFFLDVLRYGAPPHAGAGVGLDRIIMLLCGWASIRDVIAFPKTQSGSDLMMGAPAAVDPKQLRDLRIKLVEPS